MIFEKSGDVRIEQLRDEIRRNVIEFPVMAIQWNGKDAIEIDDVDGKATKYKKEIEKIIFDHTPINVYFAEEIREEKSKQLESNKVEILTIKTELNNAFSDWDKLNDAQKTEFIRIHFPDVIKIIDFLLERI